MKAVFHDRLRAAQKRGNLRVADLARWFERPHATVNEWVRHARQPTGAPNDLEFVHKALDALEKMIEQKRGFPIPRLSPGKRIEYLRAMKSEAI